MNQEIVSREQQYFYVFDKLYADGYITHEEWLALSPAEQLQAKKFTNDMIEKLMEKHHWSKGSPQQQKRYRLKWLELIGINLEDSSSDDEPKDKTIDPLYRDLVNLRTKVKQEANNKIKRIQEESQAEIAGIKEELTNYRDKFYELEKTIVELRGARDQLEKDNQLLEQKLLQEKHDKEVARNSFELEQKHHTQTKTDAKEDTKKITILKDERIGQLEKSIDDLKTAHKHDIDHLRSFAETQRQDYIMEVEKLKTERDKLKKATNEQSAELKIQQERLSNATKKCSELVAQSQKGTIAFNKLQDSHLKVQQKQAGLESSNKELMRNLSGKQKLLDQAEQKIEKLYEQIRILEREAAKAQVSKKGAK